MHGTVVALALHSPLIMEKNANAHQVTIAQYVFKETLTWTPTPLLFSPGVNVTVNAWETHGFIVQLS